MSADEHFHRFMPFLKMFALITLSVGWLVISIILYQNGTSQYSAVIEYETEEWTRGAIVDFVSKNTPQCPSGYEGVSGMFPGTKTYCRKSYFQPLFGDGYTLGTCSSKTSSDSNHNSESEGTTVYGIDKTRMMIFGNNIFCIKRDASLTYHNLA